MGLGVGRGGEGLDLWGRCISCGEGEGRRGEDERLRMCSVLISLRFLANIFLIVQFVQLAQFPC